MKQLDLNVKTPEAERLSELYPGDSINMANLRIHFDEKDEAKVWQMLKDHQIMTTIWNTWNRKNAPESTYSRDYVHPYQPRWRNFLHRLLLRWAEKLTATPRYSSSILKRKP